MKNYLVTASFRDDHVLERRFLTLEPATEFYSALLACPHELLLLEEIEVKTLKYHN